MEKKTTKLLTIEISKNRLYLGLVVVIAFLSLPLFWSGIEGRSGQDLGFHLMRIEGLATELKNGVFPVRMESLWMDGYGYAVSVFYGDTLLYIPAALRLLGVPIVAAYKCYVFLINAGTVAVSFLCFRKIFSKDGIAFAAMVGYVTATYRMTNVYQRAAVGEYSAMLFLPVVLLAMVLLYTGEADSKRQRFSNATLLAIGMTGLIETHVLTAEMVTVFMLLVAVLLWKKTFRKNTIKIYVMAVAETLVLNAYFIVPFLDYYVRENTYIKSRVSEIPQIQMNGLTLKRYLDFFTNPFQEGMGAGERMVTTPGLLLLLVFLIGIVLFLKKGRSRKEKFLTVMAALILWMASAYFPWDVLAEKSRVFRFMAQIQFPWRYISIAGVLLAMLLGVILTDIKAEKLQRGLITAVCLTAMVMCVIYAGFYGTSSQRVYYSNTEDLDTYDMGFIEYLPAGTERELFTGEVECSRTDAVCEILERKGTELTAYCQTAETTEIIFPMVNYSYYKVTDEKQQQYKVEASDNQLLQVQIPAGFDGTLSVSFVQPWYWVAAEWISLLGAVCILVILLRGKHKGQ
jgi:hypothetical protein